eukprot:GGOE01039908.1.p1 GENE.GGOE01039908.1~~GGOE01039908.1.p1  ORF type:complete len:111 (+),score=10.50 GGOE01039908.1:165-497(+)
MVEGGRTAVTPQQTSQGCHHSMYTTAHHSAMPVTALYCTGEGFSLLLLEGRGFGLGVRSMPDGAAAVRRAASPPGGGGSGAPRQALMPCSRRSTLSRALHRESSPTGNAS